MAISNMTEGGFRSGQADRRMLSTTERQALDALYFQQIIRRLTYLPSLKSQVSHPGALQHWWGEPAARGVQAMEGKDRHFHS